MGTRRIRTGSLARDLGFRHTLLVADPGIVKAGDAAAIELALESVSIRWCAFPSSPRTGQHDGRARRELRQEPGEHRFHRRGRRRQLARLRQGDQLPAHQRRRDVAVSRLRQGHRAAAAVDWHSHHGWHRQRSAELRGHLRCGDAHEDGVRRPVRRRSASRFSIRS